MANLFNGYCYDSVDVAAETELATEPRFTADGVYSPYMAGNYTIETADMTYIFTPLVGSQQYVTVTRVYPQCAEVGYQNNYTGLTIDDSIELSWMVALVWITAWAIKQMRYR
ncbi:hypothetical protein [Methylomonas rivi]|uniref:Uncharacterized protein n=1 Tax=Methylomonas rivi TaxID=2952226 RepID=A0ABT1UA10_9GAMM|nr:hypothetical protein [Methylomonas sp. WSC-6]MCQ8130466.1 hypothetical protein [Methylomonas sp. WSC-6]